MAKRLAFFGQRRVVHSIPSSLTRFLCVPIHHRTESSLKIITSVESLLLVVTFVGSTAVVLRLGSSKVL